MSARGAVQSSRCKRSSGTRSWGRRRCMPSRAWRCCGSVINGRYHDAADDLCASSGTMRLLNRHTERAINDGARGSALHDATSACFAAMLRQSTSAPGTTRPASTLDASTTRLRPPGLHPGREDHYARLHHAAMGHRPCAATSRHAARARRHGPVPDGADRDRSAEWFHDARVHLDAGPDGNRHRTERQPAGRRAA